MILGDLMSEKWKLGDNHFKCLHCGHEWKSDKDNQAMIHGQNKPLRCPSCNLYSWYIQPKSKQAKNKRIKNAKGVLVNE